MLAPMRPVYTLPGIGPLREITIWKAIVFGILTLGIYLLVVGYQNSKDIQNARETPFDLWVVFFILGIFFWPLMLVLWVFNFIGVSEIRSRIGLADSPMGIVALIFGVVFPPVGKILWAFHFNETLHLGSGR